MRPTLFCRISHLQRCHSSENSAFLYLSRRNLSHNSFSDNVPKVGYGPFSSTVKAPAARREGECSRHKEVEKRYLDLNRRLRDSLARVQDPSSLSSIPFRSAEWKAAVVQLYRTILRLHNKPLAFSLSTSLKEGPEKAMQEVSGLSKVGNHEAASSLLDEGTGLRGPSEFPSSDVMFRYVLTDDQRIFGNSFLKMQFEAHMDADSVTATNFYASWYDYIIQLASGITAKEMNDAEKKLLTDNQKSKLEDLKIGLISLRENRE